jgi:hypothetical protein
VYGYLDIVEVGVGAHGEEVENVLASCSGQRFLREGRRGGVVDETVRLFNSMCIVCILV